MGKMKSSRIMPEALKQAWKTDIHVPRKNVNKWAIGSWEEAGKGQQGTKNTLSTTVKHYNY